MPDQTHADATAAESAGGDAEDERAADEEPAGDEDAHLSDVADGCGCTEVWEHLSEHRDD